MKTAEKIQELERRIRELEARPVYVPIYVGSPLPQPCHQPLYPTTQPWQSPWITWGGGVGAQTVTAGGAVASHLVKLTGDEQISYTN